MSYCHHCYQSPNDLIRCSSCLNVWYCSSACRTSNWPIHLVDCTLDRPITTADQLVACVHRGYIPDDPETQRDFGFMHTPNHEEKIMRLNVYSKLILEHKVNTKTIRRWQKRGRLGEMMKQTFEAKVSSLGRQQEPYLWFYRHISTFDTPPPTLDETIAWLDEAYRQGWETIGRPSSDSDETIRSTIGGFTRPQADCFSFIILFSAHVHPRPGTKGWVSFGLCGCSSLGEEKLLVRQYTNLIRRVGFDVFCQAYELSSLPKLFSDNGLEITNRFVLDVLAGSPIFYKSVWYLKDLVCAENSEGEPLYLIPSVGWDYGFFNCRNQHEVAALRKAYKQVLTRPGADPIALHEACVTGKLFEHVSQFANGVKPDKKFRRLMKNAYPWNPLVSSESLL
ncbi:hypothetical protein BDV93DRAFT_447801 [Ceratobasidium sp. AG-I]|nr:hypothetical protein BDV93DRAFT_447801 [Ceratobasidium sp. AG-I]